MDLTHLTPDEKINGIGSLKVPNYLRKKVHGQDVRETMAQLAEMIIQLGVNLRLDPDEALEWARKLQQAVPQSEFDSWIATLLDGGPSIFVNTLSELQAKYPNGAAGVALVRETDPAKIYVWNGSAWEDFGDYQGIEIKDGAVTSEKIEDNSVGYDKIRENAIDLNKHVRNGHNSLNLHNIETDRYKYTINLETGDVISTETNIYLTDFIRINGNERFSSIAYHFFVFYNKYKEIISSKYLGESERNVAYNGFTPDGTKFIRMTYYANSENTPHINLGDNLSQFTPYHDNWDKLKVNGEYIENESIPLDKLSFFKKSTNLINKKTEILNTGISLTGENAGELISQADRNTSRLIKCTPKEVIIVRGCINLVEYDYRGAYVKFAYFNPADRNKGILVNLSGKTHSYRVIYSNVLPESYLQINEGSELLSWEPFEPIDTNRIFGRAASPLWNKTIFNFGDSIAQAYGLTGYHGYIASKYKMTVRNYARGGATVAPVPNDTNNHIVQTQIENAISDGGVPDYILFNGNTNDWKPYGIITEGYTDELDLTTYAGSFENIVRTLRNNYPESKIIYVSANKMRTRGVSQKAEYTRISYDICDKYSINYVDVFNKSQLNTYYGYFVGKYTISSTDATHPNDLGYEKYYIPLIEGKLKDI